MTFVATLATDSEEIYRPAWPDVEREIRALDAKERTLLILQPLPPIGAPEGCHHLAVGGGGGGRFIVYTTEDNSSFWNLVDPEVRGSQRRVLMTVGGQEGDFREGQFVSLALALGAARRYFEDGQRAEELVWEEG